jgi:hypothetical protein
MIPVLGRRAERATGRLCYGDVTPVGVPLSDADIIAAGGFQSGREAGEEQELRG